MEPELTQFGKPDSATDRGGSGASRSARTLKRLFVALIGGTVLLVGVAMIFLPGPALIVIPAGMAILATEFLWARRALRSCQGVVVQVRRRPWFRSPGREKKPAPIPPDSP